MAIAASLADGELRRVVKSEQNRGLRHALVFNFQKRQSGPFWPFSYWNLHPEASGPGIPREKHDVIRA
jgi:hypothetical protein